MSCAHQQMNENNPHSSFSLRSLRFIYIGENKRRIKVRVGHPSPYPV